MVNLPAVQQAAGRGGRLQDGSHVHYVSVGRVGAQLCGYSLAITDPAVLR